MATPRGTKSTIPAEWPAIAESEAVFDPQAGFAPGGKTTAFLKAYLDEGGDVVVERVADGFGMSRSQLAETVGLDREAFYKAKRLHAPKTQSRMREMLEIVSRVSDWAGGKEQAMAWYRAEPIPAFGDRTAESLVKTGKASAVRDYLDYLAMGGFA
jgi:uncharacterized protein (DUF2384 family)